MWEEAGEAEVMMLSDVEEDACGVIDENLLWTLQYITLHLHIIGFSALGGYTEGPLVSMPKKKQGGTPQMKTTILICMVSLWHTARPNTKHATSNMPTRCLATKGKMPAGTNSAVRRSPRTLKMHTLTTMAARRPDSLAAPSPCIMMKTKTKTKTKTKINLPMTWTMRATANNA